MESADLLRTLRALRRRMIVRDFLRTAARATLFFYALLVALTGMAWWFGAFRPNPAGLPFTLGWPFAFGAVAGLLVALIRTPPLRRVAEIADALGGTRDRLLTALDFSAKERTAPLEELALRESLAFAKGRDFRPLLPLRPPHELRWLAVPLATLALFWWDGLRQAAAQSRQIAAANAEVATTVKQLDDAAKQLAKDARDEDEMKRIAERLKQAAMQIRAEAEQGRDAQKTALRELAQLEQLVRELRRPDAATPDEIKALADALAKHEQTKDAAKDMAEGKFADAAKKLEQAAKDEPTAHQIEQSVQQAMEHLARKKEQVSKQLEQLRQQAAEGGERQELLRQLAETLNEMQQNGQLAKQPGGKQRQQQGGGGKEMSDEQLKKLLGALQKMKDQQQRGDGDGEAQPGEGEGEGKGDVSMLSFAEGGKDDGKEMPNIPSGQPGSEKDEGTSENPFGKGAEARDTADGQQLTGKLATGESLSALVPSAAGGDAKAARRYKQLTEAAAAAAEDAVVQENIPLGARHLIRRYFEAIRPK